jgi:hypothetical protein
MSSSRQRSDPNATTALGYGLWAQASCTRPRRNVRSSGRFHELPSRITMALIPRIWLPIAIALLACHRAAPPTSAPARCGPNVPSSAQHPITSRPATLAGEYDLIQVRTQPVGGQITSGRLHLFPLDSTARALAIGGAARDLTGWLEPAESDSAWRSNVGSRDPNHPGVVLTGDHLRLGQGSLDGYAEHLTITAVSPEGFWGWWRAQSGFEVPTDTAADRVLPEPAGYFCALR